MKKQVKALALLLTGLTLLSACGQQNTAESTAATETTTTVQATTAAETTEAVPSTEAEGTSPVCYRVYSLKGPTSMGLVKLMQEQDALGEAADWSFSVTSAADEITAALVSGKADFALLPANAAAALYNKTGCLKIIAVNNLGVLHLVENGDSIHSLKDLAGKTVILTGKGTTPEYALRYLLAREGLENQVTLEFKSEAAEVAAALAAETETVGLLPEPYVTSALLQNSSLRRALDLNELWEAATEGKALVTGVAVVRAELLQEDPEAAERFLKAMETSVSYTLEQPSEAAQLIAELGIVGKAAIAEKALPGCHLAFSKGSEMRSLTQVYLQTLYDQNPSAIGGKMPDEGFWYE